jgi:hypothetical protein
MSNLVWTGIGAVLSIGGLIWWIYHSKKKHRETIAKELEKTHPGAGKRYLDLIRII